MEKEFDNKPQATQADVINRKQLIDRLDEISSGFDDNSTQEDADAYNKTVAQLKALVDSRNWYCQTFEQDGKVGLTDCSGTEVLIPAIYDSVPLTWHNDQRCLTPVKLDGRYGFVLPDGKGTMVVPCKFCRVKFVPDGDFFLVKLENDGKWGLVNMRGAQVLPCCADEVLLNVDGNVTYRVEDKWGVALLDGSLRIDALYDKVELDDVDKPYCFYKDGVKGFVTQDAQFISEADYNALSEGGERCSIAI